MLRFLRLSRFSRRSVDGNDSARPELDSALRKSFAKVRSVDPETHKHWTRLRAALANNPVAVQDVRPRVRPRLAIGVGILAFAVIGIAAWLITLQPAVTILATGRGEQKHLTLADGSEVDLHHTTELVVLEMRTGKSRRVSLKGEAFFRVRRNDTPFIVSTNEASVEVMGTEFNVRSRNESLEVAVLGGKVKVTEAGSDSAIILVRDQIGVSRMNEAPRLAGEIPSADYPGWLSGKLFLENTSFADACREIELRFDSNITVADERVRERSISGVLDARTARNAVAGLCALTGTRYTQKDNGFEIHR